MRGQQEFVQQEFVQNFVQMAVILQSKWQSVSHRMIVALPTGRRNYPRPQNFFRAEFQLVSISYWKTPAQHLKRP
jgi:hypothetical protein